MTSLFLSTALLAAGPLADPAAPEFYLPADPKYGIVDSALDSIRFTLGKLELEKGADGGGARGR